MVNSIFSVNTKTEFTKFTDWNNFLIDCIPQNCFFFVSNLEDNIHPLFHPITNFRSVISFLSKHLLDPTELTFRYSSF